MGGMPGGTGGVPGGPVGVLGGDPGGNMGGAMGEPGPTGNKGPVSDIAMLVGGKTGCSRCMFTGGIADSSPRGGFSASSMGVPNCMGGIIRAWSGGSWRLTGVWGFSDRRLPQRARA